MMSSGYGQFNGKENKHWLSHRLVWHLAGHPDHPHLHHKCGVKACVNPDHLEGHTASSHVQPHTEQRTHCKWGHPFDEVNTYWRTDRRGQKSRQCRQCKARVMRNLNKG